MDIGILVSGEFIQFQFNRSFITNEVDELRNAY